MQPLPPAREATFSFARSRNKERAIIFDRNVLFRDDQKQDRQDDHDGRDDDSHLEEPAVNKLDDVEIGLGSEQIVDANHQGCCKIREGPDENQECSEI